MITHAGTRLMVLLLVAGASACAMPGKPRGGPVAEGPGTLTAARKYLEGRWQLESFEVFPPGKPPIALKGQGTLTYDEFGNLHMEIRTDEPTADLLRAAGVYTRDGVISTEGRTAVDLQNRTLTYIVKDQAQSTGPLALNRPRHWQVEADLLTLTTKDDGGAPLSVGRWRRMP